MHSVGAHCGQSARWVLRGGTSTRDHANSVMALARKRQQPRGSAKATVSRLVSTCLGVNSINPDPRRRRFVSTAGAPVSRLVGKGTENVRLGEEEIHA